MGLQPTQKTVATSVEMFRKTLDRGEAGDNIGILVRGAKRDDVQRGQVVGKPGTLKAYKKFEAEVHVLFSKQLSCYQLQPSSLNCRFTA